MKRLTDEELEHLAACFDEDAKRTDPFCLTDAETMACVARELRTLRALLTSIEEDFDHAIAAHDVSDPRHRSNGGQHTNGRCCSFGNVTVGAVIHMRRLRDAIRAALASREGM